MKHILITFGTRPEVIKLAPVIKALKKDFKISVLHTGQHKELVEPLLSLFDIEPDYRLNIMQPGQDLFDLTGSLLPKLKETLLSETPDYVMVQGDTTTSYLTALSAFYEKIPVLHVEAGLRSHDIYYPFPEEMNRKQISQLAHIHFAPTETSRQNLLNEGMDPTHIFVTGNTVIDALNMIQSSSVYSKSKPAILSSIPETKKLIVLTAHRRENHGQPLLNIFEAVSTIMAKHKEVEVIFPAHPNPNVQEAIRESGIKGRQFHRTEPYDYLPFLHILERADFILSDSGGIQEEAAALGKQVLVLRDETERQELIKAGLGKLVGSNRQRIIEESEALLKSPKNKKPTAVFGEGNAAEKIRAKLNDLP